MESIPLHAKKHLISDKKILHYEEFVINRLLGHFETVS